MDSTQEQTSIQKLIQQTSTPKLTYHDQLIQYKDSNTTRDCCTMLSYKLAQKLKLIHKGSKIAFKILKQLKLPKCKEEKEKENLGMKKKFYIEKTIKAMQ